MTTSEFYQEMGEAAQYWKSRQDGTRSKHEFSGDLTQFFMHHGLSDIEDAIGAVDRLDPKQDVRAYIGAIITVVAGLKDMAKRHAKNRTLAHIADDLCLEDLKRLYTWCIGTEQVNRLAREQQEWSDRLNYITTTADKALDHIGTLEIHIRSDRSHDPKEVAKYGDEYSWVDQATTALSLVQEGHDLPARIHAVQSFLPAVIYDAERLHTLSVRDKIICRNKLMAACAILEESQKPASDELTHLDDQLAEACRQRDAFGNVDIAQVELFVTKHHPLYSPAMLLRRCNEASLAAFPDFVGKVVGAITKNGGRVVFRPKKL